MAAEVGILCSHIVRLVAMGGTWDRVGGLLPAIARITDAAAVLASLAELAGLEGELNT